MADPSRAEIDEYAREHTTPVGAALDELERETQATQGSPQMLSGPVEGRFLETLVFALRAERVLEIGTYSGYSALAMAGGLTASGSIVTLELDPDRAAFAREHIARSPYADRIEVVVGPALESVEQLEGPFDFVFIDADKDGYPDYYEASLARLSEHGLIAVDNTLRGGSVVHERNVMSDFNDMVLADERVVCTLLTVRDGVTLIRRRG
jgi:caffeoyl-CoA O-methyltransferase